MSQYNQKNNDSTVTRFDISNQLPIIPLIGDPVVFPFMPPVPPLSPHQIALSGENVSAAVEHATVYEQRFLCLFRQTVEKEPKHLGADDLRPVGSLVHIVRYKKDEENVLFLAQGKARVLIDEVLRTDPFLNARVRLIEDEILSDFEGVESEALTQTAVDIFSQIVSISTRYQEEFAIIADSIDRPGRLADYIASVISLKTEDKQRILELINVKDRFNALVKMLSQELNLVELESKIQSDAEVEINQSQKELGDTEDLSVEIDEYRDQIKKRRKQSQRKSRQFLGIVFKCCNIYSRIHLNKKRTAFVGWCPKCAKPARVKVSSTGSESRFFRLIRYQADLVNLTTIR